MYFDTRPYLMEELPKLLHGVFSFEIVASVMRRVACDRKQGHHAEVAEVRRIAIEAAVKLRRNRKRLIQGYISRNEGFPIERFHGAGRKELDDPTAKHEHRFN